VTPDGSSVSVAVMAQTIFSWRRVVDSAPKPPS
jgi:hypothetical protein